LGPPEHYPQVNKAICPLSYRNFGLENIGQRRTLAARQAALSTVPVYVRPTSGGDEKAQVAQRVAEQIVENDHRTDI
jgi:hypothetical protein